MKKHSSIVFLKTILFGVFLVSSGNTSEDLKCINIIKNCYKAKLLICLNGTKKSNSNCDVLSDLEGPYKTEDRCISRVHEMLNDVEEYRPKYYTEGYKCEKL